MLCETPSLSRRRLLGASGALFAWAYMPKFAFASTGRRDARFIVIVLRGALDGMAAVAPVGDPAYAGLHGDIALRLDGDHPALPLDGFFALHPAMPNFARFYKAGQAAVVHAVATPYRQRSHFDGQDVLESGQPGPGLTRSGWLNRLVLALPKGERVAPHGADGIGLLGVGSTAPLIARGAAPVMGWGPAVLPHAGDDLARRVMNLYTHSDPALAKALGEGLDTERMASSSMQGGDMKARGGPASPVAMQQAAEGAARLMAAADGPRIAALAFEGWDTHAREGGATGLLANRLGGLDKALAAFESGLGPDIWKDTAIMVVTEFGRTVRVNGTDGTDHGTGTVAFLAGGAVKGGRVMADWPGLADAQLYEGRDLKPTTDLRAVAKGLVGDLFGVSAPVLARDVFPDSAAARPMNGLVV